MGDVVLARFLPKKFFLSDLSDIREGYRMFSDIKTEDNAKQAEMSCYQIQDLTEQDTINIGFFNNILPNRKNVAGYCILYPDLIAPLGVEFDWNNTPKRHVDIILPIDKASRNTVCAEIRKTVKKEHVVYFDRANYNI